MITVPTDEWYKCAMEPTTHAVPLSDDDVETILQWACDAREGKSPDDELALRLASFLPEANREGWADEFKAEIGGDASADATSAHNPDDPDKTPAAGVSVKVGIEHKGE
jgi:hypothetical protein